MLKAFAKTLLAHSPVALTQNMRYDRLTRAILDRVLRPTSNCLDVGCHKGEILDEMLRRAPDGDHVGFEPIPALASALERKYAAQPAVTIRRLALSDTAGPADFNHVVTNPSYSGLERRSYDRSGERDRRITVERARLDDVAEAGRRVDLVKIDVEGGELGVLRGAARLLAEWRPVVVFEFGLGAADHYGATPGDVYDVLAKAGLGVRTLAGFLDEAPLLTAAAFARLYDERREYYFAASSARASTLAA